MSDSNHMISTRHGGVDHTYTSTGLVYDTPNTNKVTGFTGTQSYVLIPDTVTEIGISAFSNNTTITHVQIGTGMITINNTAFLGCTSLEQVTINSTVLTTLGDAVFSGCSNLTTINLPASLSTMGYNIFKLCSSLTTLNIDPGNAYISVEGASDDDTTYFDSMPLSLYIDTRAITIECEITSTDTTFTPGETATVTFSMSTPTTRFNNSFIRVAGGTLSTVTPPCCGCTYTATFTPTPDISESGSIYVSGTTSDATTTFSSTQLDLEINTLETDVTCTIESSRTTFMPGQTATVTFNMSTPTTKFSNSFITVVGGSLSTVDSDDGGSTYTATFTPTPDRSESGSIYVSGTTSDATTTFSSSQFDLTITTKVTEVTCTINSDKTTLYAGQTATITFTMSPATSKFSSSVIVLNYGTLSTPTTTDNVTYTATFTPSVSTTASGSISVSGTSSDSTTSFPSRSLSLSIITSKTYVTISSGKTSLSANKTATITFTMSNSVSSFASSNLTISSGTIGTISVTANTSNKTYTATYTSSSPFTGTTIAVSSSNSSFVSNTVTISKSSTSSSSSSASKAPIKGALVYYVDSNGNMLANSPTATTDENGKFTIATEIEGPPRRDFSNEPLGVFGGENTLTGQTNTYWFAKAKTVTMTPITNLLFYCSTSGSLTNADIIDGVGITDDDIDFSDYDDYVILTTTTDKSSDYYKNALIANNLGNAINIFATIGSYFLYAINGTNLNTEYDAMMRSIANISTSRVDQATPPVIHNDFAELFGTDIDECSAIIADRMRNIIDNEDLLDTDSATQKTYAELFAKALAQEIAGIMTSAMASDNFSNSQDYELIGYNVAPYIYNLASTIKTSLSESTNDKNDILTYFTEQLGIIFETVISAQNAVVDTVGAIPGFSNRQTLGNIRSSENAMMRRQVVKSWNTAYATGNVNGASRVVTPFRAVTNSGDFLQRENYVCGGPNQVNASKPGWKGRIGSIISNCDNSGIPSSTCNVKYVPDASDYIKYKKLRANNQNYNDLKGGGYQNSSYTNLMRVRRR